MQVTQQEIQEWHAAGIRYADSFKRSEFHLVEVLRNMAASQGHYLYKCQNLKEYATLMWNLSENVISDMVIVANKAVEIPEMLDVLRERKTTVSKLRKICPVITPPDAK